MSQVKLVSITKPLVEIDNKELTPEQYITYIARVSNPKNQTNLNTSTKLLKYCIDKKHFSIFEQVDLTVEIQTSRAISAQLIRHRSGVFQEYSQRYSKVQSMEPIELRLQDAKNRQNSLDIVANLTIDKVDVFNDDIELMSLLKTTQLLLQELNNNYAKLVDYGVAKECARMILPLASTTNMYMKNNLRNWIHYVEVRALGEGVQKEHREIAVAIQNIIKEQFPIVSEALNW